MARVPSAASRFVSWLADHGADVPRPLAAEPEVVEEVAAQRLDDGYEVNATFGTDDRPVSRDEVERAIRWLGFARADLLALRERIYEFEAGGGRLEPEQRAPLALTSGASAGRAIDEVLRHVAGAESWFGSRLDPAARTGPNAGGLRPVAQPTMSHLVEWPIHNHKQSASWATAVADMGGIWWCADAPVAVHSPSSRWFPSYSRLFGDSVRSAPVQRSPPIRRRSCDD